MGWIVVPGAAAIRIPRGIIRHQKDAVVPEAPEPGPLVLYEAVEASRRAIKLLVGEYPGRISSILLGPGFLAAAISMPIFVCFAGSGEGEVEINFGLVNEQ